MKFWLGTHEVSWVGRTDVPLFLSRRRLARQKSWRRALGPWALDSGGFTELSMHGRWSITTGQYVEEVLTWQEKIGNLAWCAPMDWMCEPSVVRKTGLSVYEHHDLTINNFLTLREQLGPLVVPVLQGWELDHYLLHIDRYAEAGVDLREEPLVGVGSVCRRNADDEIVTVLAELADAGIKMHAFGVRGSALQVVRSFVESADSMAWSFRARMAHRGNEPRPTECVHKGSCSNCLPFALWWRGEQLARPALPVGSYQLPLVPKEV